MHKGYSFFVANLMLLFFFFWNVDTALASDESTPHTNLPLTPLTATFPFSDNFESGVLSSNWIINTTAQGVAEIDTEAPYSGTKHIFVGQRSAAFSTASLELAINLSGQDDVFLDFWWQALGNTGSGQNNISISNNDGATWVSINNLSGSPDRYGHRVFNLAKVAKDNSLTLNERFRIRFYYVSWSSGVTGGYRFDDIRITNRAANITSFPFFDNFESNTFVQGFFPQTTAQGMVAIDSEKPYSGTKHIFVGQKVAGFSTASLELAIDLTGQNDVFLDFWWQSEGITLRGENGVFISDNDGEKWYRVHYLNGSPVRYGHVVINLTQEISNYDLKLNNRFRIQFFYMSQSLGETGGYRIDDIRITNRASNIASFPFSDSFELEKYSQGLFPQTISQGMAEIDAEDPYSGTKHVFVGQKVAGFSTATLELVVDLSGKDSVFIDFWLCPVGVTLRGENGFSISDDDGKTWIEINDLSSASDHYEHLVIDLAKEAELNNKKLNNRFRIRFFYMSWSLGETGGYKIDELRLGSIDPSLINRSKVYLPLVQK